MKRYVAFLRGINVSGQKIIKMELLKEIMAIPGFKNVTTYIQSGNIAFDCKETDTELLRRKIEKKLVKDLGYEVPVVVRSIDELKVIIANNPFDKIGDNNKKVIYVNFLGEAPAKEKQALLEPYIGADEQVVIRNKEIYFLAANYGNTKFTNSIVEKKLGTTSTVRNWNTVNKMITL